MFGDRSGLSDYDLLHSTHRDHLQNTNWMNQLQVQSQCPFDLDSIPALFAGIFYAVYVFNHASAVSQNKYCVFR